VCFTYKAQNKSQDQKPECTKQGFVCLLHIYNKYLSARQKTKFRKMWKSWLWMEKRSYTSFNCSQQCRSPFLSDLLGLSTIVRKPSSFCSKIVLKNCFDDPQEQYLIWKFQQQQFRHNHKIRCLHYMIEKNFFKA
jgi:hypothetical protein